VRTAAATSRSITRRQHRLARGHPGNRSSARGPRRWPTCDPVPTPVRACSPHRRARALGRTALSHVSPPGFRRRRGRVFRAFEMPREGGSSGLAGFKIVLLCRGLVQAGNAVPQLSAVSGSSDGSSGFAVSASGEGSGARGQVGDPLVDLAAGGEDGSSGRCGAVGRGLGGFVLSATAG